MISTYKHTHIHNTYTHVQLEARLERMERRLAVHQKRNTANTSDADSSAPPTMVTPSASVTRRISRVESLTLSEGLTRNRSASVESASRSRTRLASHLGPSIEEGHGIDGKRTARKRIRVEENSVALNPTPKRVRKTTKRSELRTKMEYEGLELTLPAEDSIVGQAIPSVNHVDGLVRIRHQDTEAPALKQIIGMLVYMHSHPHILIHWLYCYGPAYTYCFLVLLRRGDILKYILFFIGFSGFFLSGEIKDLGSDLQMFCWEDGLSQLVAVFCGLLWCSMYYTATGYFGSIYQHTKSIILCTYVLVTLRES